MVFNGGKGGLSASPSGPSACGGRLCRCFGFVLLVVIGVLLYTCMNLMAKNDAVTERLYRYGRELSSVRMKLDSCEKNSVQIKSEASGQLRYTANLKTELGNCRQQTDDFRRKLETAAVESKSKDDSWRQTDTVNKNQIASLKDELNRIKETQNVANRECEKKSKAECEEKTIVELAHVLRVLRAKYGSEPVAELAKAGIDVTRVLQFMSGSQLSDTNQVRRPGQVEPPKQSLDQPPKQSLDQPPKPDQGQPPKPGQDQPPKPGQDQPPKPGQDQPPKQSLDQPPKQSLDQPPKPGQDQPPKSGQDQIPKPGQDQPPKPGQDQPPKQGQDQTPKPGQDQPPKQSLDQPPKQSLDQPPNPGQDQLKPGQNQSKPGQELPQGDKQSKATENITKEEGEGKKKPGSEQETIGRLKPESDQKQSKAGEAKKEDNSNKSDGATGNQGERETMKKEGQSKEEGKEKDGAVAKKNDGGYQNPDKSVVARDEVDDDE